MMTRIRTTSRTIALVALAGALAVAALATTGCVRVPLPASQVSGTTPGEPEEYNVDAGNATKLKADFRMGVGEMKVQAGTPEGTAFAGRFDYAPASWKPTIESTTESDTVDLTVSQPSEIKFKLGEQRNTWNLYLTPKLLADLQFKLGVGESDLDLRGLDLNSLHVVTGVGDTRIDLSGEHADDFDVDLETGVGNTVVRLPSDCRIDILGSADGLGNLDADGFTKVEGGYRYFGHGGPQITIVVTRGVGDLSFELVDK